MDATNLYFGEPATRAGRIAGCMFGAAIGDALGAAFEFVDSDVIERHLGEPIVRAYVPALSDSLLYPRAPGRPTDDTAMALSVALAVASGEPLTPNLFAERFVADLERTTGLFGEMFWSGGPGGATTRALRRLRSGTDPAHCGHNEDGGNGAAMRAHPIGFLTERDAVLEAAAAQAKVTHGHPAAIAAAQAVAIIVYESLQGVALSADLPQGIRNETFAKTWSELHANLSPTGLALPSRLRNVAMSGWETVCAAHAIAMCFPDDAAAAIGVAAASGGDTDTVGSITGAIAGARHGIASLPKHLIERLAARPLLDDVIARLRGSMNGAGVRERDAHGAA